MSIVKKIFTDSIVYGLGNAITKFLQILLLPIISNNIQSESIFNQWNNVQIVVNIFAVLMLFGQESTFARFNIEKENSQKKLFFNSGYIIMIIFVLIVLLFNIPICKNKIQNFIGYSLDTLQLNLIFTWAFLNSILSFVQNYFRWTYKKFYFILIAFSQIIFNIILLYVFLQQKKMFTVSALIDVNIIVSTIILATIVLINYKKFTGGFYIDFSLQKKMFLFGLPLMFVALLSTFRISVDRFFFIFYKLPDDQVYAYNISLRISSLFLIFSTAIDLALSPILFKLWDKKNADKLFANMFTIIAVLGIFFCIYLSLFSNILIQLFAKTNNDIAKNLFPLFLFSNLIFSFFSFFSIGINFSKKTFLNLYSFCFSLFILKHV